MEYFSNGVVQTLKYEIYFLNSSSFPVIIIFKKLWSIKTEENAINFVFLTEILCEIFKLKNIDLHHFIC